MKLSHLLAHGFSEKTVAQWRRMRDDALLPLQAHAVAQTGLLRGQSLLVAAPTSAGKTFVGEMAAARCVEKGGRALFVVPMRALAHELSARFQATYAALGWRVVHSSADERSHDAAIARGEFEIAVLVYEKLRSLLVAAPELAGLVGCVVADEVQLLGDAERGGCADVVLTLVRRAPTPPQLVAMSAVLVEPERLARWLNAELLVWHERPVELREGVLNPTTGEFFYREWNTRCLGEERLFPEGCCLSEGDSVAGGGFDPGVAGAVQTVSALARELVAHRGEQLLVFVPTKGLAQTLASRLAEGLALPPAAQVREVFHLADESLLAKSLSQALGGGVGFHHADLSARLRQIIERGFAEGEIRVLVATSTLAQGVNLGCRNVLSLPTMVRQGDIAAEPVLVPLSRAQLHNQGGRAGRYGSGQSFGRSMILAPSAAQTDQFFELYIRQAAEPLAVKVTTEQLAGASLAWLVARRVSTSSHSSVWVGSDELADFVGGLCSAQLSNSRMTNALARSALELLESAGLVQSQGGRVAATGLGEVAAQCGLNAATALHLHEWLEAFEKGLPAEELFFLVAAASSPLGARFALTASAREVRCAKYLRQCHELLDRLGLEIEKFPFCLAGGGMTARDHHALKKALCAYAWVSGRPTMEIEATFSLYGGTIESLGQHLGWLVEAMGDMMGRLGVMPELQEEAHLLAERLRLGLPPHALELGRACGAQLSRSHVLALARAGFTTLEDLRQVELSELARLAPESSWGPLREFLAPRKNCASPQSRGSGGTATPETASVSRGQAESASPRVSGGRERRDDESKKRALSAQKKSRAHCDGALEAEPPPTSPCLAGDGELTESRKQRDRGSTAPGGRKPTARAPSCVQSGEPLSAGHISVDHDDGQDHGGLCVAAEPLLEIDPHSPGVTRLNGAQIFLSVLPFRLLLYLARHARRVVPYEELDAELWPDAKVEQQQILAHKATIVRHFARVVGQETARRILRTVPGHGLYLDVDCLVGHEGRCA